MSKIFELCPYCNNETELLNDMKLQPCKHCGKPIAPCSICNNDEIDCSKCILERNDIHKLHSIKIHPMYYMHIEKGIKTFEVRKNDRNYQTGDYLLLREYNNEENIYTGRQLLVEIIYILKEYMKDDYVVLGIRLDNKNESNLLSDLQQDLILANAKIRTRDQLIRIQQLVVSVLIGIAVPLIIWWIYFLK